MPHQHGTLKSAAAEVLRDLKSIPGAGNTQILLIGAHAAAMHIPQFRPTTELDFLVSFKGPSEPLSNALAATYPAKYMVSTEGELYLKLGHHAILIDFMTLAALDKAFPVIHRCPRISEITNPRDVLASIGDLVLFKMDALESQHRSATKRQTDIRDIRALIAHAEYFYDPPVRDHHAQWIWRQLRVDGPRYHEVYEELLGLVPKYLQK